MKDQLSFYKAKLEFEIDSWDLFDSINQGLNIKVIDARSGEAYQLEHIPGSINLPHRTMSVETTQILEKETLYVTYCDGIGCNASTKGAYNLTKLGFKVKELMGGLDWWKRDGYQTEGSKSQNGTGIVCGC
ncbi:MAG: rhodanese-like domain-containing protein [Mariniphaga sp.]